MSSTESDTTDNTAETPRKGKGKGKEVIEKHEENLPPRNFPGTGPGFLVNGKFHCHCEGNPRANCLTVKTVSKNTYGKKCKYLSGPIDLATEFLIDPLDWKCPNNNHNNTSNNKCSFYLWDDDVAEAKEWHAKYGPPPPEPKTPVSNRKKMAVGRSPETPWTKAKAKGKRKAVEVSDGEEEPANDAPLEVSSSDGEEVQEIDNPFKVAKATEVSTPFNERLRNAGLPTPDTGRRPAEAGPAPKLDDAIMFNCVNEKKSDLATKVMNILRKENIMLKEGTELSIRHEIEMEMAVCDTRVRVGEETISKLKNRLDFFEGAFDEPVELSD
jgi:hypothetical protein